MARRERNAEQRMWPWRRRSSDQTSLEENSFGFLQNGNLQVAAELKESLKTLGEKLTSAIDESNAKDVLLEKHARVAEEALEGWEKAESEAAFFKQELENAEKKLSQERERSETLQHKLETLERETESNLLSLETENSSLKQDLSMLEDELLTLNEQKSKKVTELEAECQRLKTMLRRRIPSSAALGSPPPPPPFSKFASLEEEIRVLSDALGKKTVELQSAWIMCARTASKLSRAETELDELRQNGGGGGAPASPAASWASALISELENFRPKNPAAVTPEADPEKPTSPVSLSTSDSLSLSSLKRLAELAEEMKFKAKDCGLAFMSFQWETREILGVLEGFLQNCQLFMEQKSDPEGLLQALVSALEWAAGNCSPSPKAKEQTTGWEISMASEKLAECQETIFNLGKQLKMLSVPKEEVVEKKNPSRSVALGEWIMADKEEKNSKIGLLYGMGLERCEVKGEREEMGAVVVAHKRASRRVSLLFRRLLLKRKEKAARMLAFHSVSI